MPPSSDMWNLPPRFCWTKFCTEAGEAIDDIFRRKEQERLSNNGLFLWGIGNSVAPGIRMLVEREAVPLVAFSPMRSKPKFVDVVPGKTVRWLRAYEPTGQEWDIPEASIVISRASAAAGKAKQVHYALVCYSDTPLCRTTQAPPLYVDTLSNARSGTKLGHSQVTSIVERSADVEGKGSAYPVQLIAKLVYPFFVELREPIPTNVDIASDRVRQWTQRRRQVTLPLL